MSVLRINERLGNDTSAPVVVDEAGRLQGPVDAVHVAAEPDGLVQRCARCGCVLEDSARHREHTDGTEVQPIWFPVGRLIAEATERFAGASRRRLWTLSASVVDAKGRGCTPCRP